MRTDGASPAEIGSIKFLEKISSAKSPEKSKAKEKFSADERKCAKNLLATRNKTRLKALHAQGNHLHDQRLLVNPVDIKDGSAYTLLGLQKKLFQVGGVQLVKEFLSTPYALQFIEDFADYDANKLALAFHTRSMVKKVCQVPFSLDDLSFT